MNYRPDTPPTSGQPSVQRDPGYSFGELLITVVLIGVLASIVTATIRNVTAEAADAGCDTDGRTVLMAATSYLAQELADSIPATGAGTDRYEHTLVDAGYLRSPSALFDLAADGTVTPQENSPC